MFKEITIAEAMDLPDIVLADVRSEKEFKEATIPGAINIPLLDDEQRALVGVIYREEGPEKARRFGLELVAPKLKDLISDFDRLGKKNLVVFCWRGGLRSKFVADLLDNMGYSVYRVAGGYKAYRRFVNKYLNENKLPLRAVVLYGLAGVGKTDILQGLAKRGIPVLDLEGLACHRGSVFGKIGLPPSPSQKMFEGMIFQFFYSHQKAGIFVSECESPRLGNLYVPKNLLIVMREGYRILVHAPLEVRIKRIIETYTSGPNNNIDQLGESIKSLEKQLGKRRTQELGALLAKKEFEKAFTFLLTSYYDLLYNYPDKPSDQYDISIDSTDLERAILLIETFILGLPEYNISKKDLSEAKGALRLKGGGSCENWGGAKTSQGSQRDFPGGS